MTAALSVPREHADAIALPVPATSLSSSLFPGRGRLLGVSLTSADTNPNGAHTVQNTFTAGSSGALVYNGPCIYYGALVSNTDTAAAAVSLSNSVGAYSAANRVDRVPSVAAGADGRDIGLAGAAGIYCPAGLWAQLDAAVTANPVNLTTIVLPLAPGGDNFTLIDGGDANGGALVPLHIPAGGGLTLWFGPHGIIFRGGLFQVSGASISGVVWIERPNRS